MISQLLKIIRESIKAVPAMKYALAVAGLLAVVAMAGAFKLSPQRAVVGAVVTLVLMVGMVVFARLTTTAPRHFFLPVQVMMWAFLVVTVGTAFLLFTSAFFHWPRGLHELFDPAPAAPLTGTNRPSDLMDVRALIATAREQRAERDYAGAWATIGTALARAGNLDEVRDEQRQIAMGWIRDMVVRPPDTFTSTLRPLTDCLRPQALTAKGTMAGDLHAHLGWANFLRWRDGAKELQVERNYAAGVEHDPKNPFAHAMWGHWKAVQNRPLAEITHHFALALESRRERAYVQNLRIAALLWTYTRETAAELLRVADQMRKAGEPLATTSRRNICNAVYSRLGSEDEAAVLSALPLPDQLATLRWLLEDRKDESADLTYFRARLTEAAGDPETAASQYRALLAINPSRVARVEAGLARCEQRIAERARERAGR
jgi:hypothetical protein